jgi:hypothetical protein
MEVLIRLFALLMTALFTVHAEDTLLLNAHIRMIPKIMALDTQALSHSSSGKAILGIVYDDNRKNSAKKIADEINSNHNGNVGALPFIAIAISVDELVIRHDIAFAYLIDMSKSSVNKVASWGTSNNSPTFSYNAQNLDLGILGTIVIERSTVIYINKNVLKAGKFRFNDSLFQIARLVE